MQHLLAARPARRRGPRLAATIAATGLVLGVVSAATGVIPHLPAAAARADEVTASQDDLRTGWDPNEPGLAPSTVHGGSFGQLFETHLQGQIYAQPIVAGQTLIVTTEENYVYGLNAATGAIEWSKYLGPPEPSTALHCGDLTPDVGITSTPVYDASTGTVYLFAVVHDGTTSAPVHEYMYAMNAQTGAVLPNWPVPIQGSPVNGPGEVFNPFTERQRTGLLELNGWIYAGFASYCDYQPYLGYVVGVNTTTGAETLWSDEAGVTDSQGGIWQGGGGLMSDGAGRIFVSTGNGVSPAPGAGTSPPPELGDAVVRLNVNADGSLSAADFFSPANAPTLDNGDKDFGSGGPVGLPFGTSSYPDLLVQAGKDGRVFLLNRDNLGGREQGPGGTDDDVSMTGPYQGQWGHPAVFGPDGPTVSTATSDDYVYYVGKNDEMRYLQFGVNAAGTPVLTDVANSSKTMGYSSGSPVVTSNGDDPSSAVVWEVDSSGESGVNSSLDAFAAEPSSTCTGTSQCTMNPIWSAPIGTASKFTIPATDSGRVYVGTRDGNIFAFSSPDAAPIGGKPVGFGKVAVGGAGAKKTVTMTATQAVTVDSASVTSTAATNPFKAGAVSVNGTAVTSWPVSLSQGDKLTVPVTFKPTATGGVNGYLQLATEAVNFPTVSVSLSGNGTAPGFSADPATFTFGQVPSGTSKFTNITVTNSSTGTERIASVRAPAAPFSARLPRPGTVLKSGQSVTVQITTRPKKPGTYNSFVRIRAASGRSVTVPVTVIGAPARTHMVAGHASIAFGPVQLGTRATQTIDITNDGNLPATVIGASGPAAPFGAQADVPAGLPLNPHYDLEVPVSFTPTSTGAVQGTFRLSWRDARGRHHMSVAVSGTGTAASGSVVPPPGGGWTLNGSANMSARALLLTGGVGSNRAGSAVYAVPQPGNGLIVSFKAKLAGHGGMTVGLLNATGSSPSSLGSGGSQLGFGGLHGVAVTLRDSGGHGEVRVATGSSRGHLVYAGPAARVPAFTSPQAVTLTVTGSQLAVTVAGAKVLSVQLGSGVLPSTGLVAFTGSSGAGGTAVASSMAVTAGGDRLPEPGGGWSFNGSAGMAGDAAELTPARRDKAGSVVYRAAVPTDGLNVTFTADLSGGNGANGLTFALLNPADAKTSSVGGDGGNEGFGGLDGVAVMLVTSKSGKLFRCANCVVLANGTGGKLGVVTTFQAVPPLRPGPDTVQVQVTESGGNYVLTMWLDGVQVIQEAAPWLTSTSMLAFTGGTGLGTDVHIVRDVAISEGS